MIRLCNYVAFTFIVSSIFICTEKPTASQQCMLDTICAYQGSRTFLLSFPRSGNTWLRYCLEYLTQRPSITSDMQSPIGWIAEFPVDIHKAPIHRIHNKYQTKIFRLPQEPINSNPAVDKLILIVRNPHETIGRNNEWLILLKKKSPHAHMLRSYFDNIEFFETWPSDTRLLIYYEDLILTPRETLICILTFLGEPPIRLEQFMQEYHGHKKRCLTLYINSISNGDDILYHSKHISQDMLCALDTWIENTYPHIWDTYLKERFAIAR